jgi:hypothetical protein
VEVVSAARRSTPGRFGGPHGPGRSRGSRARREQELRWIRGRPEHPAARPHRSFLTFAVDHGLCTDCEAHGNGDSGIYPGSASDLHGVRHAVQIRRCDSHHNTLGVSGTAGNSLWIHDNDFHHNSAGISFDSFVPDHPGLPQDSSVVEDNRLRSNDVNYYDHWADGTCDRPSAEPGYESGVVCPVVPVPVGTGILLAGGNDNVYRDNRMWDNWRYGGMQLSVPAAVRQETDPEKAFDTSHFNRWIGNTMGVARTARRRSTAPTSGRSRAVRATAGRPTRPGTARSPATRAASRTAVLRPSSVPRTRSSWRSWCRAPPARRRTTTRSAATG